MNSGKTAVFLIATAFLASAFAIPVDEYFYNNNALEDIEDAQEIYDPRDELQEELVRSRRSLQPGAPGFPVPSNNKNGGWEASPNVNRDDRGNTNAGVQIKNKGENHDFDAGWGKVVRGPGKAKPTWHVGGTIRW